MKFCCCNIIDMVEYLYSGQIQYTTPSDLQWKFPLVSELIEAIVAVEELVSTGGGEGSAIRHEQFKYGRDETLVLYNAAEKARVDMLLPYHTAQVSCTIRLLCVCYN